ncbi:MAG: hypothetical protein AAGA08_16995 [Pseudomonadota bacterium]
MKSLTGVKNKFMGALSVAFFAGGGVMAEPISVYVTPLKSVDEACGIDFVQVVDFAYFRSRGTVQQIPDLTDDYLRPNQKFYWVRIWPHQLTIGDKDVGCVMFTTADESHWTHVGGTSGETLANFVTWNIFTHSIALNRGQTERANRAVFENFQALVKANAGEEF